MTIDRRSRKVLAFHTPKEGVLAVAYYDPETAVLHVVEDTKDSAEFDLARLGELFRRLAAPDRNQ